MNEELRNATYGEDYPFGGFLCDMMGAMPNLSSVNLRSDILEGKDNYKVTIEMPGVKKEDIALSLKDGYLTVSYNLKKEKEDGYKVNLSERGEGKYARDYYVGPNMKKSDIKASLADGILTLILNKPEAEKEQTIAVE